MFQDKCLIFGNMEDRKTKSVKKIRAKPYPSAEEKLSMVEEAAAGVYASTFFDLTTLFHLTKEQLASMFHISLKSLMRYRDSRQKLNPAQSEQVLKLKALHKKGTELFGNDKAFHRWLDKPAFGLGNRIPVKLMNTSTGIDLIMDELKRIEWGDLA